MPQALRKLQMAYLDFLFLFQKWEDVTETDSCNILFNLLDTKLSTVYKTVTPFIPFLTPALHGTHHCQRP